MSSSYLTLLGLAKRAGKLEVGDEASRAACGAAMAKAILVASDASERTQGTFRFLAETTEIPYIPVAETREEIGNALGKRPTAVVCICDTGLAAAILGKLAGENEDAKAALPALEKRVQKSSARKKAKCRNKRN